MGILSTRNDSDVADLILKINESKSDRGLGSNEAKIFANIVYVGGEDGYMLQKALKGDLSKSDLESLRNRQ